MRSGRIVRAAATGCLVVLSIGLGGCVADETADPAPTPAGTDPSPTPDATPDPGAGDGLARLRTGLDVRTLDPDGSVSTVEVRDFPR